jgi:hypothetical protein
MTAEEYGNTKEIAAQVISLLASLQNNYFTEKTIFLAAVVLEDHLLLKYLPGMHWQH